MTPDAAADATTAREARLRRFVDEYVIDHNAVRAYLAAFGRATAAGRPRSYNAACVEASKLLKTPEVRQEIRAAQQMIRRRTRVTADKVVNELAALAFSDIGDVLDFAATGLPAPKPARDVPQVARKALQSSASGIATFRAAGGGGRRVQAAPKAPRLGEAVRPPRPVSPRQSTRGVP